ncbi:hypothetical protein BDM02DRAFT_2358489 [Thelephora ganbajun]|uniref:Uncharacterized protein n=1 Tax=Thelephora ganbajun TaxID=370292 RepID=A0ACB6ZET7_THEGA|nr:hypothetical protein BDM02DRAFT_2358489 [Thelephora ganbajun]
MIIAHVLLDAPTLKACSMTCRSWYIATLPHLHHTLTLRKYPSDPTHAELRPLRKLDKMRLLPFVKRLRILQGGLTASPWFLPTTFNCRNLAYFSTLTNVQVLGIDNLDLGMFVPEAQLYFGHFTSTLRSLTLRTPRGTYNQLLYLLGLFPNIDDFRLIYYPTPESPPPGQVLVPRSAPSLRGRLTLSSFGGEGFLRDLSKLAGGLRFRHMDLFDADGTRFLLDTCADTLETLRIYPGIDQTEPPETLLRNFDLFKSRSLRSLEITVASFPQDRSYGVLSFLMDLLPTITSPTFSDVVVVLGYRDILDVHFFQYILFEMLRGMHEIKPFRLVFRLEIWDSDLEETLKRLRRHIDMEEARGGLEFLSCPPVIVSDTRATPGPPTL